MSLKSDQMIRPCLGLPGGRSWTAVLLAAGVLGCFAASPAWAYQSTNIGLNQSENLLFVANRLANSVTVFEVSQDLTKLDEVGVGREPICVAIKGQRAYVANAASNTVSVIEKQGNGFEVVDEFPVAEEPRGCLLSPNGAQLLVTSFTGGTVGIYDAASGDLTHEVDVGGNPYGLTIRGNIVFVTQFFARLIEAGRARGSTTARKGWCGPSPQSPGPAGRDHALAARGLRVCR